MAATLLNYTRKEYYLQEIKDIISQLDEYNTLHTPQPELAE